MPELITDALGNDGNNVIAHGLVANRLLDMNFNVNALRTNATLRKDEWELLDKSIVMPSRERLSAAGDLMSRGLVLDVPNGMGTTIVQHETASEMTAANVSMDGRSRGEQDRVVFSLVSIPLPIIHKDFQINARALAASRNGGTPLDTTQAAEAAIQVAETIEGMVLNGYSANDVLGFGSSTGTLYGYTNFPNRNTVSIGTNWDAEATPAGDAILTDVLAMLSSANTAQMYGPYMMYVPTNYWITLLGEFKANSDKSIMTRLLEIPSLLGIKAADKLADDNVVLVQMTSNNVDIALGLQPTVLQWETEGGMNLNFKVMAIMVPRIKADYQSNSGIVHLS